MSLLTVITVSSSENRTAEGHNAASFCHTQYECAICLVMHARQLGVIKGKRNADRKVCREVGVAERTAECKQKKGSVWEGRRWPACGIMSPDDGERAMPAANPHMHSGWNSNNPKSSSVEFQRARGRQINQREREAANRKQ